ncbi:hypothetical protein ACFVW1_36030 [Streptomyces olivochromogenes]|uniref:hypothetical protein n=1 Tax=Streptomyces olivochromogenes TaxID=1963 RepID=UPI0036D9CDDC
MGGLRTGSDGVLAFDVDVPKDGTYDLSVFANSNNLYGLVQEQGPTNVFLRVDGTDPQELLLPLGYKWVVWGHTDTTVRLTAGRHRITLAAQDADLGVTKGDAIIDKIDLALRDKNVTSPAIYETEYATLTGTRPQYTYRDASGPGAVPLSKGASATFWLYSPTDGEATLSLDRLGGGRAEVTLNGEKLDVAGADARKKGTDVVRAFLSGGINKITVTGASHGLVRPGNTDRLDVAGRGCACRQSLWSWAGDPADRRRPGSTAVCDQPTAQAVTTTTASSRNSVHRVVGVRVCDCPHTEPCEPVAGPHPDLDPPSGTTS